MAGILPARVGGGGIYSLAIMASANETSVLYGGNASLLRHCCGHGKDEGRRCGEGVSMCFQWFIEFPEFTLLSKFNSAFYSNNSDR